MLYLFLISSEKETNFLEKKFKEDGFIPDFTKIIEYSRVNPKYIELEITESLFLKNPKAIIKKLKKPKKLKVKTQYLIYAAVAHR